MSKVIIETKVSRVFSAFMTGQSYNRFEAEMKLHDHCLHSTVSTIEKKYQITISRKFETVNGYKVSPTRVCRYWINSEERMRYKIRKARLRRLSNTASEQAVETGLKVNKDEHAFIADKAKADLNNGM